MKLFIMSYEVNNIRQHVFSDTQNSSRYHTMYRQYKRQNKQKLRIKSTMSNTIIKTTNEQVTLNVSICTLSSAWNGYWD